MIRVPELALVLLVGPAGAGKSTFAAARFRPTEVVSSDAFRALVADDERDQSATAAAFEVLHLVVGHRLRRRRLTVVDAVSVRPEARRTLLDIAREHDVAAVAIVFELPEATCVEQDRAREGRTVGGATIERQAADLRRSLPGLGAEGFAAVWTLDSPEAARGAVVRRTPLPVNRRWDRGPFDVVGEVRGRAPALEALLHSMGYAGSPPAHPEGRRAVFVGDLVGAGPDGDAVLDLVAGMAAAGTALCVRGDEDDALLRERPVALLAGAPSHYVLDRGGLVVVHAGIETAMQGRDSARILAFATGGVDPGWAARYRGRALVVHGHEPVGEVRRSGRTVAIDTAGAGRLSAFRYPELETVWVPI